MNLFQMLAINPCTEELGVVVGAVKTIFTLIQWAIPLVLIVMGTLDMFKAMASGDEKKTKEAKDKFIRRLIYAVVAFLIPFIISLVFRFVGNMFNDNEASNTFADFMKCWDGNYGSSNERTGYCTYPAGNIAKVSEKVCKDAGGSFDPID